ncbi:hypothetical protein BGLA2_780007 [Burkholderia gladioli]|nr:hypothetical protein BGLA2_780007 [Burkholderia gladioli]
MNTSDLPLVDNRPDCDVFAERVAYRQPLRALSKCIEIGVCHAALNDMPARSHADLTLMKKRTPGTC